MESKAQIILNLFYSLFNEDFSSSSDFDRAKNSKRARASKLGWVKHRNKYISGMNRNIRLKNMFGDKKPFLIQLRARIKKIKTALRQKKEYELRKKQQAEKYKFNLMDSQY